MKISKTLKSILVAILFLCLGVLSAQAKVYIVSAGISDYPGSVNDLTLPAKDAKTIYNVYKKNAGADGMEGVLLINKDATRDNIIAAIKRTFAKATQNDIVILFFSGHGYPGGFRAYDQRVPYSDVRAAMAPSRSDNKMIFADACYSGKMRTSGKGSDKSAKKANVMLFLSSRENETSIERPFMDNGIFTTYLTRALSGEADANRDRIVTAKELFDFVHKGVIYRSQDKQHPVMWGKFKTTMPVIKW